MYIYIYIHTYIHTHIREGAGPALREGGGEAEVRAAERVRPGAHVIV